MKKFAFKYQSVLRVRLTREELAKKDYGAALELQKKAELELKRMQESIVNARQKAHESLQGETGDHLFSSNVESFITGSLVKITYKEHEIKQLSEKAEEKRLTYMETYRDRKGMEKLKEKQEKKYLKESKKKELKLIEDTVMARFARTED